MEKNQRLIQFLLKVIPAGVDASFGNERGSYLFLPSLVVLHAGTLHQGPLTEALRTSGRPVT